MNDDILYKRQESPTPEFVAELQEKLRSMDSPEKAKRKNGQRYINWKAIAAVFVFISIGTGIFVTTPEINIPVITMLLGYPTDTALKDAQEMLGFEIPEIPSGYYLGGVQFSSGDMFIDSINLYGEHASGGDLSIPVTNLLAYWANYRGHCAIGLSIDATVEHDEEWYADYYDYLDERSDKVEVIELGNDTVGLWRWLTTDNVAYGMTLEWHHENIRYELEGYLESMFGDCISREEFIAIAQSTLDDKP